MLTIGEPRVGTSCVVNSIPTNLLFITEQYSIKIAVMHRHPVAKLDPKIVITRLKSLHTLQMVRIQTIKYCSVWIRQVDQTSLELYSLRYVLAGPVCTISSTATGCSAACFCLRDTTVTVSRNLWCQQTFSCLGFRGSENIYDISQLLPCCYQHRIHKYNICQGTQCE
jgi:hypothetical protein